MVVEDAEEREGGGVQGRPRRQDEEGDGQLFLVGQRTEVGSRVMVREQSDGDGELLFVHRTDTGHRVMLMAGCYSFIRGQTEGTQVILRRAFELLMHNSMSHVCANMYSCRPTQSLHAAPRVYTLPHTGTHTTRTRLGQKDDGEPGEELGGPHCDRRGGRVVAVVA